MRTTPLLLLLAVTGCAPEDAALPLAPPEPAVAGGSVTAAAADGDLVCEWDSAEDAGGGLWLVRCRRANDNASGLCWYLVTYRCTGGFREGTTCVKVSEELVGCEGEEECTEEQRNIDAEYDDRGLYNPRDHEPLDFQCWDFDDTDFTRGIGTHDHTVGFLSIKNGVYREHVRTCCTGINLTITSDWRCPQGNANVGGVIGSYHMEGDGADYAKTNGAELTQAEWQRIRDFAVDELYASDDGISDWGDPCTDCFQYKRWIHVDWR